MPKLTVLARESDYVLNDSMRSAPERWRLWRVATLQAGCTSVSLTATEHTLELRPLPLRVASESLTDGVSHTFRLSTDALTTVPGCSPSL